MMQSTSAAPALSPLNGKPILLGFDGADMSSDAGLNLLREIERKAGLAHRLADCLNASRDLAKVQHSLCDIIRFRIMMIAPGRARCDCCDVQERSGKLSAMIEDETVRMPDKVRGIARVYVDHIQGLTAQIAEMTEAMKAVAKTSTVMKRLQTVPGVGLQTAMAIETFAPDLTCFAQGRDFSAWLGLVPRQNSTGGKSRLGKVSKMGQVDIRSHLIRGAMSVITAACRFGVKKDSWLERLLARKPKLVAAITLANRMARAILAMMTKNEDYRNPEAVA